MADCVLDASVVHKANGDITARKPGNAFDKRLIVLKQVVDGVRRLRYNAKLKREYENLVYEDGKVDSRNDVIELFFEVLADKAVLVNRNNLSRQHYAKAVEKCRWPTHDQHLIAAAVGGDNPTIFVTEDYLAGCAAKILAAFNIHVEHLQ